MSAFDRRERRDDPNAPVPAWRVDGMERRLDRLERESRDRVTRVEDRVSGLYDTLVTRTLIQVAVLTVFVLILSAASASR
jgi:hypothetical protein